KKETRCPTGWRVFFCTKSGRLQLSTAVGAFSLEKTMLQLLLLTLILFTAMAHAQNPKSDMRRSQSGEILIPGPIDKVFPLFTPKGELLWIPTWKYTPVFPPSGETERDMVFRTDDGATTWTLAVYDPPNKSIY